MVKLNLLLKGTGINVTKDIKDIEIKGIAYNSIKVKRSYFFIAIKGFTTDGHNFIQEAVEKGAAVIGVEEFWAKTHSTESIKYNNRVIPYIIARDNRILLSRVSANFYSHPSKKIKIIGITGTNGKTTTSFLLESIFRSAKIKTGVIGTINYRIGRKIFTAFTTTPESLDLNFYLNKMVNMNRKVCIMEVSSHSLALHRVDDINFDYAIFTNLTEDHFDFHKNFKNYFNSKKRLFFILEQTCKRKKIGVVNIDDRYGQKLFKEFNRKLKFLTYGLNKEADVKAENIITDFKGITFDLIYKNNKYKFYSPLIGFYNIYNILASISIGLLENIPIDIIKKGIKSLKLVPGRMEIIRHNGIIVGIDYAHTEDALKKVLLSIRELKPKRIITVFGAGGDRDKKKRPKMGRVATKLSDFVVITSDNPRTENPERIIEDIEKGVINRNYKKIIDRRDAIFYALRKAKQGDFVLIAGKGHETYQIIGNRKYHFDDKEVVLEFFKIGVNDA